MAGEPWQTFLDPASLLSDLLALGFEKAEELGPEELNARYFAGRKGNLRVSGFGHLMNAIV
jgi:hypothetical protein